MNRQRESTLFAWTRHATAAVDLLFPPTCLYCTAELPQVVSDVLLCGECLGELSPDNLTACGRCASPVAPSDSVKPDCPRCRGRGYHFDAAVTLAVYRGLPRDAVIRMKKPLDEPLAVAIGTLLGQRLHERLVDPRPHVVCPVPMHWLRRWTRGINGAEIFAERVSRVSGLPVAYDLLSIKRRMKKQGTLSPRERLANVRGGFRVTTGHSIDQLHVLLVDDVLTTGATASEIARTLKRAGASRVTVAVAARGVG